MRNPFTHKKLDEVEDSAAAHGHGDRMEARGGPRRRPAQTR